eukprot:TRINITY_DN11390_c0_g1::TRINITY_DN11390_c0_g1_i1::g.26371::m.26371 TRINITY_DN11390_c0_g1::TRINITY_DN11390_c0_g1_i1::g.26371  ORF type:complete len:893 (+),score=272.38,sp/Q92973/TNPO1_HUMAN/45.12/0.0,HEAT/PF02985.17/0.12,HEAT/PF02985.17/5.9e+02,HEAT/PF02985.17/2.3,HEAT/PF02985.17/48,HEAT/PF02985.17/1e+02,HEAT/PF02985.17/3.9e-07,HEAT/PF02985.17/0.0014,HEAT/PF02985.17/0.11,HEAT/PF02985.17/0.0034,HEAT/PF02985.17/0.41,HEAT_2/PF13646.1/0.034,HEAT_2/PF13646.1/13,HEAT_2/PF13646.1/0.002,HEAT_2/PF13646.1/
MESIPNWEPNQEGLSQIIHLLRQSQASDTQVQDEIRKQFEHFVATVPEFPNYLVYVMVRVSQEAVDVKQAAGTLLKVCTQNYVNWPQPTRAFVKQEIVHVIGDQTRQVRKAAANCISAIVLIEGLARWPELIPALAQCLDSNSYSHIEGAMTVLYNVSEDNPEQLDKQDIDRPLNIVVPKVLNLMKHSEANIRQHALSFLKNILYMQALALVTNMEAYLQGIFAVAMDTDPIVRQRVCESLVLVLELQSPHLMPHLNNVIEYMLQASRDPCEEVAREACEFWSVLAEQRQSKELLEPYLARLVPVLVHRMVYSEMDQLTLDTGDEDAHIADREEDIRPRFHRSKGIEADDEDDDGDGEVSQWNLRKCSAAGLDILSSVFGSDLLHFLLPIIQAKLNDPDWVVRESAILALGAVAEGCLNGMDQHLPQLIPYLISLLDDKKPLVRSITCWTLSRYCRWVLCQDDMETYLDLLVKGFLVRIRDKNKRVQQAACSAFATLAEEVTTELLPYLRMIMETLVYALQAYQAKNLMLVYDCIGTMADSVGNEMNEPEILQLLMPALMAKWNSVPDTDSKKLIPMLECFTALSTAFGLSFAPYAALAFQRCLSLVAQCLEANKQLEQNIQASDARVAHIRDHLADKDYIVSSLDLLSGLCEGLGPNIESLVSNSTLVQLVYQCMQDAQPDVRQSAFALVGDLAKTCVHQLRPVIDVYVPVFIHNLQVTNISVCNNAIWALGEIGVRLRDEIRPYVVNVLQFLINIMTKTELNKALLENTAITIGRLGMILPEAFANQLPIYLRDWCQSLRNIRDDVEKEDAFRGLCAIVRLNPGACVEPFPFLLDAIASWDIESLSPELRNELMNLLIFFKNNAGSAENWASFFNSLAPPLQARLIPWGI